MSATGLDVFDKTLQTTHVWLDELMQDDAIGPNKQQAWHVLGAVLRATRNRLPLTLAAHLGAQLPILLRGAYYDQFRPVEQPERQRSADEFLQAVGSDLAAARPVNLPGATRAVFRTLSHHVNQGQIDKVREAMPGDIRTLWPDGAADGSPTRR